MLKECPNPTDIIVVLGAAKKVEKQFPVVVKGLRINWGGNWGFGDWAWGIGHWALGIG